MPKELIVGPLMATMPSGDHGSISSTFCEQLLREIIPKAQKDTEDLTLFALLGSERIKSDHKHVGEID